MTITREELDDIMHDQARNCAEVMADRFIRKPEIGRVITIAATVFIVVAGGIALAWRTFADVNREVGGHEIRLNQNDRDHTMIQANIENLRKSQDVKLDLILNKLEAR